MKKSAVVLLSAGLDSTVNLLIAKDEFEIAKVLTFDYGQRAAKKEIEQSKLICKTYSLPHLVITLDWFAALSPSALNDRSADVPVQSKVKLDDPIVAKESAKAVWVPNRNGVFLNVGASVAEALGAEVVIPGFNKEEAETFPDNSAAYLNATNHALQYSTQFPKVRAHCYTVGMDKYEIVKKGRDLKAPFDLMWPCYFDGPQLCGECESCRRFLRAMKV